MKEPKLKNFNSPFNGSLLVGPNDGCSHPGILLLHGSEGGGFPASKCSAIRLASEGYVVLAYSYFGSKDGLTGPRETLADIEIQNVLDALIWLKKSELVGGKKVALDGTSRGGELALISASIAFSKLKNFDSLDAIAVHSPGNKVWGPWNHDWIDTRCWLSDMPSSYEEYLANSDQFTWNPKCGPDPRSLPENLRYAWKWQNVPLIEGDRIEVENIRCPIFISQGLKDTVWPAQQSLDIEKILIQNKLIHEVAFYENDDHGLCLESSYDRQKRLLSFYEKYLIRVG